MLARGSESIAWGAVETSAAQSSAAGMRGVLSMKLSLGPRQLVISLSPNAINGSKLANDVRSRGAETDNDYAKLANRNQAKLERAQNELSGFFSGSRQG